MSTAVPPVQFTPSGLVLPTESAILAGVQADQNAAFGGNLNPGLNTPQGQLASSEAAIIANANDIFAQIVNQVDPDTSNGFMQDAIGRIYFLSRLPGTPTSVLLTCTGLFGTSIPVGSQAQDTSGNIYVCQEAGIIGAGGNVVLPFANTVNGPIAAPMNTVTQIYQAISGWDSVNNASDGVEGANVETAIAFEFRRKQSVAINGQGSLPAIYAACFAVPGVIDVYVTQNNTGSTINTGSTSFPVIARSVYVAVVGGNALAVATAIWKAVNIGAAYQTGAGSAGATLVTQNVSDQSGYSIPIPTYPVSFIEPAPTPIYFAVTITNSTLLPSDIVTRVKNAIIASFTGADGSARARVGSQILASKFYGPVQAIGPEVSILTIFIGAAPTPTGSSVLVGIDQVPTVIAANITVALV